MAPDYTRRVCSEGFLPLPRHDGLSRLFAIHFGFKGICLPLYIDVPEALNVPFQLVPQGTALIRISCMATHATAQLERVLEAFERSGRERVCIDDCR